MRMRFLIKEAARPFSLIIFLTVFGGILLTGAPLAIGKASSVIVVNSAADNLKNDNACTLREAIIAANKDQRSGSKPNECQAGDGADIIHIPAELESVTLTRSDNGNEDSSATGDLDISEDVTIESIGGTVLINAIEDYSDRIFHIHSGEITIHGLTISGGRVDGSGGGILNLSRLSLTNVTITDNSASANGGGLANLGVMAVNNVTVAGNTSDVDFSGQGNGGGIYHSGSTFTISNSIIAGNSSGGALLISPDCFGNLESLGYSLVENNTACQLSGDIAGNILGQDPLLEPLANSSGELLAFSPAEGSPTIDAGNPATPGSNPAACEVTDQFGAFRPHGVRCDMGSVEEGRTNATNLIRVFSDSETTTVVGKFSSTPNLTFEVQVFSSSSPDSDCNIPGNCDPVGDPFLIYTDENGHVIFSETLNIAVPWGQFAQAVVTDPAGFESDFSEAVRIGAGNDSWPSALLVHLTGDTDAQASVEDYINFEGQSRWFKFQVKPGSKLFITLTDLPENYDLTLFKDITQAFQTVDDQEDLLRLGAEFAPDAFTPDAFTSDVFSPDAFTPDAFTPDAFTPDAFTPDAFTPDAFTPDAFTPDAFTPDAFTPDAFTPDAFTPDAFTPDAFTPDAFTPDAFTPESFSSAQTRSLIAISAFDGLVSEGIRISTWDNTGEYYVRVRGRNGIFNKDLPFELTIRQISGSCSEISADGLPSISLPPEPGDFKTLILKFSGSIEGSASEIELMDTKLETFAARSEVGGVIIDTSLDDRVIAAYQQAAMYPECPNAQNLLAESIKMIVESSREINPGLRYILIIGPDASIPFFRHPDHSMLASEKNYAPPVQDGTPSQASLKLGYVLSQDDYGAHTTISLKDDTFPLPSIPVGRLVETATDISTMLDAYLSTGNGVVSTPDSSFVSGYDFLVDAATAVQNEFLLGLGPGAVTDSLVTPRDLAPTDPTSWNADDLRSTLLGSRHDLIFLAGHFSASSALAADYETRLLAGELASSTVDLTNTILFSAGCHAGYNIVNPHGIVGLTREPDWAQAAAQKGISLIAGTGYQYGDTDLIKYSERLYLEFSRQLRSGTGAVSIGEALVKAKQKYLAETPYLRGIDEKALLEATLFGFPMLKVDLPGERLSDNPNSSIVSGVEVFGQNPGAELGLAYADIRINPQTALNSVELTNIKDLTTKPTAVYLTGKNGEVTKPNEPTLPLDIYNVGVNGTVLRGVGFRGGSYQDIPEILPLTGAAATEIRGVHTPFVSNVFFPAKPWYINSFEALADVTGGINQLVLIPGQYKSTSPTSLTGTMRQHDQMDFRLFFSGNVEKYIDATGVVSIPSLAAPPAIVKVTSEISGTTATFTVRVVGNPAAGIQETWITYHEENGSPFGAWQSVDLTQHPGDSSIWKASLELGGMDPLDMRFMVQAVNGVGLVSLDTNYGRYYIPGLNTGPTQPTSLELISSNSGSSIPTSGNYSENVDFSAQLTASGLPLAGQPVAFVLGSQSRVALTDDQGVAQVSLSIFGLSGENEVRASFAGAGDFQASFAEAPFTIHRQFTQISVEPEMPVGLPQEVQILTATLTDINDRRLGEETLFFVIGGSGGTYAEAIITDYAGRTRLGNIPLPPGNYSLDIYFSGSIPALEVNLEDDRYEPAHFSGSINLLNQVPQALNDDYSIDEDMLLSVNAPGVLANDFDPDQSELEAVLVSDTDHGNLTLNPDGSFVYQPDQDFNGLDQFYYSAFDGLDLSTPASVTITVQPINDPPLANADEYEMDENTSLVVSSPGVLANDTDLDGDLLEAFVVQEPSSGMLVLSPDGGFSYTPDPDFVGVDSFHYMANDGILNSSPTEVLVTVNQVNNPPDCTNAYPSPAYLWPPNSRLKRVDIEGVSDPDGDVLTLDIYAVFQDEPVGSQPDATLFGSFVRLRSERDGSGDGRVYHIFFNADDGNGEACLGEILLGVVPHDQSGNLPPIDGGALYDSTIPE